ncbi:MAG: TonB-dependent receptor, partial [Candidatus Latescibacterota bacterium]|nr:TonB-dependent receptor [Candidatus Latescibacterota bacterium]
MQHWITIALLLTASALTAQTTGQISGKITDKATKQPLPDAVVAIVGTKQGSTTDTEGHFLISGVEENIYKLKVSFIGYDPFLETDVRVVRGKTTYLEEVELIQSVLEAAETVVAGYFREDAQAPVSAFTYTRDEIRRTPGATGDVFRAMETLPGVSTSGGEFSAFSVRGGSPEENIILIDNIPFDKVSHFNGGSTEEQDKQGGRFSLFAPNLIEEARFQAGGFSAVYGGKLASFLDIKIKEGNRQTPTVDGRFDITGWELNYDGPISMVANTSLVFSGRHTNFTRILELTGQDDLGRPRFNDWIVKTTTALNPRHKISVLGIFAPEKFDKEVEHVFNSDDSAANDIVDYQESKSLIGLNWRFLTGKASVLQTSLYQRRTDRLIHVGKAWPTTNPPQSQNDFQSRSFLTQDNLETELGLRSVFTYVRSPQTTLTTGLEFSRTRFDNALTQTGLDTLYTFDRQAFRPDPDIYYLVRPPEFVNARFDANKNLFAAFGEWSISPTRRLTTNAGLRYEYNEFNAKRYLSPRLSATYRLAPQTRLNFATGVYYQTPDLDIVTATPLNENLANERAYHLIGGLTRYLRDDLKFTAETYYKSLKNLIVRPDRGHPQRTNAGDGWAAGADFSLIKRFVDKFYGQINYSYALSERDDHDGQGAYNSDFNQPHIFNILAGYEFNESWAFSAKWRYATGRPKDAYIVHENIFNDPAILRYAQE